MELQSNEGALNKKMEEDKLSDLPDSLIQHILSFLPTRDAIRTGVLSKRWRNQWRQVPILRFDCKNIKYMKKVLNQYDCSKALKLCISARDYLRKKRYSKELSLQYHHLHSLDRFGLPEFLFGFTLLSKLKTRFCTLQPKEIVNWKHLKEFKADCCVFPDRAIENILSGCPVLESLRLRSCDFYHLVIASKSLRKLALVGLNVYYVGIWCPNLEELRLEKLYCAYTIEDESIELCDTVRLTVKGELVITSASLKKLVLNSFTISYLIISCPLLEELKLLCLLGIKTARLLNLWSLISMSIDLDWTSQIKGILLQLQHVNELTLQRQLITALSCSKGKDGTDFSNLSLSNKCLTLDCPTSDGVALALQIFYTLEKLVIKLPTYNGMIADDSSSSNTNLLNCSVRRLRIVQIDGLLENTGHCKGVLNFVEFVLKNAQILEKLTVTIKNSGMNFASDISQKISNVQWSSQHAIVELLHL